MDLKLLHTGDLHIGMMYADYPEQVKKALVEARFESLARMVDLANKTGCHLLVIAGDLFNKINPLKRDLDRVASLLQGFAGACVLVLPGNHDYDDGMSELWDYLQKRMVDNLLLLRENRCYSLAEYNLDAVVYPACCHAKHSDVNNLGWIKELGEKPPGKWHIGLAHGALQGLSPDLDNKYFNMSQQELEDLGLDLWLLGHTHKRYPEQEKITGWKIYNAGTPEPDGFDCIHGGSAWLITLTGAGEVCGETVATGQYRFYDLKRLVEDETYLAAIREELLAGRPEAKLVRLSLSGRIDRALLDQKAMLAEELAEKLAYFLLEDTALKVKVTKEVIEKEFTVNSFPYQLLKELSSSQEDEEALHLAYEFIREVRDESNPV